MENGGFVWKVGGRAATFPSDIPDSGGIHQWPVQEGETTTVEDIIGTRDLSLNTDFTADEPNAVDGRILDPDGVDDEASNTNADSPTGDMTIAITLDGGFDGESATIEYGDSADGNASVRVLRSVSSGNLTWSVFDGNGNTYNATYSPTSGLIRVVGVLDTTSDEIRIYENGNLQDTTATGGESFGTEATQLHFAIRQFGGFEYGGRIDNPAVDDEVWSDSKITSDYNDQPWS